MKSFFSQISDLFPPAPFFFLLLLLFFPVVYGGPFWYLVLAGSPALPEGQRTDELET